MPNKIFRSSSMNDDDALIARALHEAIDRRFNDHAGTAADLEVASAMDAVLQARFPDAARALAEADRIRDAIRAGYLPPPGGATSKSVRAFLDRRREKILKAGPASAAQNFDEELDPLPF